MAEENYSKRIIRNLMINFALKSHVQIVQVSCMKLKNLNL